MQIGGQKSTADKKQKKLTHFLTSFTYTPLRFINYLNVLCDFFHQHF